jgi:putative transposase
MARRKAPRIPDAILDQLLAGADPKTAFEADGLLDELKKALAERALNAEMDHHLAGEDAGNTRNGYGRKTVTTETGRIELAIPRDRQATFDPQLIARYQRRFPGFDDNPWVITNIPLSRPARIYESTTSFERNRSAGTTPGLSAVC